MVSIQSLKSLGLTHSHVTQYLGVKKATVQWWVRLASLVPYILFLKVSQSHISQSNTFSADSPSWSIECHKCHTHYVKQNWEWILSPLVANYIVLQFIILSFGHFKLSQGVWRQICWCGFGELERGAHALSPALSEINAVPWANLLSRIVNSIASGER